MATKSDEQRKAMFANMANPRSKRKSKDLKRPKRSGSVLSSPFSTRNLPRRLPIVTVKGVKYFRDDRLKEFRAVDDPHKCISFKDISAAGDWMDSIHPKDGKRIYILSEEIKAKQREAVEKKRKIAQSSSNKSKKAPKSWGIIKSERATVLKGSTIWKMQYAPREKFIRKNLTVDARKKWDSSTEVEKVIAIDRLESKGFFRKRGIQNV